jgi:hypothetical protein
VIDEYVERFDVGYGDLLAQIQNLTARVHELERRLEIVERSD